MARILMVVWAQVLARFTASVQKHLSDEQQISWLGSLLIPIARIGFRNGETWTRLFDVAERMKVHILPVGYYSPVPDTSALREDIWTERLDDIVKFDASAQCALIGRLTPRAAEMATTPENPVGTGPVEYTWRNPVFNPVDATIYYAMIREFSPKRIIEIGGGYSTLVALQAAERNTDTHVICIEPNPREFLTAGRRGLDRLIPSSLQDVSLEEFDVLEKGDMLFIDSTHICQIGSDVNRVVFHLLPRIKPGVLIHFHDIFLPWNYPRHWSKEMKLFSNEQYLLLAFLMFNDSFEVLLANCYLLTEQKEEMRRALPFLPDWAWKGACSLWMRRR